LIVTGNFNQYCSSGKTKAEIFVPSDFYTVQYYYTVEIYDYVEQFDPETGEYYKELLLLDNESSWDEGNPSFYVLSTSSSEYMDKPINFGKSASIRNGKIEKYYVEAWPMYAFQNQEQDGFHYGVVMKRDGVENGSDGPVWILDACSLEIPENGTGGVTYNMSAVNRLEFWWNGECVARLDSDPTYYSGFIHERLWKHFERGWGMPFSYEVCVYGQGEEGSRTDHVEVCAKKDDWYPDPEGFVVIPDSVDIGSYRSTIDADYTGSFVDLPSVEWVEFHPSGSPIEMQFGPTVSPVTVIRAEAFKNNEMLTGVEIGANVTFIGKEAFAGCTNLDTVRCMAEVPPVMEDENCFDCYKTATLVVPEGSIDAYKNADWWKKFFHNTHIDIVKGDVNKDGRIDINDVTALIGYLLNGHADPFDEYQADVNYDNNIDINDVTLLINWVLGRQ